MGLHIWQVTHN